MPSVPVLSTISPDQPVLPPLSVTCTGAVFDQLPAGSTGQHRAVRLAGGLSRVNVSTPIAIVPAVPADRLHRFVKSI